MSRFYGPPMQMICLFLMVVLRKSLLVIRSSKTAKKYFKHFWQVLNALIRFLAIFNNTDKSDSLEDLCKFHKNSGMSGQD